MPGGLVPAVQALAAAEIGHLRPATSDGHDLVWSIVSGVQIRSDQIRSDQIITAGLDSDMAAVWESCTERRQVYEGRESVLVNAWQGQRRALCVSKRRIFDPFSIGMIRFHLGRAVHSSGKRLEWELP